MFAAVLPFCAATVNDGPLIPSRPAVAAFPANAPNLELQILFERSNASEIRLLPRDNVTCAEDFGAQLIAWSARGSRDASNAERRSQKQTTGIACRCKLLSPKQEHYFPS